MWELLETATNDMGIGGTEAGVGNSKVMETWEQGSKAEDEQTEGAGVTKTGGSDLLVSPINGVQALLSNVFLNARPTCQAENQSGAAALAMHLDQNHFGAAVADVESAGDAVVLERLMVLEEKVKSLYFSFRYSQKAKYHHLML